MAYYTLQKKNVKGEDTAATQILVLRISNSRGAIIRR